MRVKKLKRRLLCVILTFCMIAGNLMYVAATEPTEQSGQVSETSEETLTETSEETPEESMTTTPEESTTTTPEESTTTMPEESTTTTPEESTTTMPEEGTTTTPEEGTTTTPEEGTTTTPEESTTTTPEEGTTTTPEEGTTTTPGEDDVIDESEENTEEEEEEQEEDQEEEQEDDILQDLLTSNPIQTFATSGVQTTALDAESELEYTKMISQNADGTYKLTLTVKAPEVTTANDILFVLDMSASMGSRIEDAGKLIMEIQDFVETMGSGRIGIVGFYGWAGAYRRTSSSLGFTSSISNLQHGYDLPLYVSFTDWASDNKISVGFRPYDDKEDYFITTLRNNYNTIEALLGYRNVIPDANSLDGKIYQEDWMSANEYAENSNSRYSLFYGTNWTAGYIAARDMLKADDVSGATMVFITDGNPNASVSYTSPLASDILSSSGKLKTLADATAYGTNIAQWRGWLHSSFVSKIISLRLWGDSADDGTLVDDNLLQERIKLIGYPTYGEALTNAEVNLDELRNSGKIITRSGSNDVAILEQISGDDDGKSVKAAMSLLKQEILKDYYHDVTITDVLSEYVNRIDGNISVSVKYPNEEDIKTVTVNGVSENTELGNSTVNVTRNDGIAGNESKVETNKYVSVTFNDYLVPGATYSVSFDIEPSQYAYDTYASFKNSNSFPNTTTEPNRDNFPHLGDEDTCDADPAISSGVYGFYTNTEATLDGSKGATDFDTLSYPKPVVRVKLLSVPVNKKWVQPTKTSYPEVEIGLYQDDKTAPYRTVKFTSGTSSSSTTTKSLSFENVPPGHKYTVKEITSLSDYQVSYSPTSYVAGAAALDTIGFTITNTKLIPIKITKEWNVVDVPASLTVGVANTATAVQSANIATATLNASNNWSATVYVPYKTSGSYYIREYYSQPSGITVTTTAQCITASGDSESMDVSTAYSGRRQVTLAASSLPTTSEIIFTNTEQISIEVEKQWSVINSSLIPSSLTIGVGTSSAKSSDIATVTLAPAESGDMTWSGTIIVPYNSDISSYFFKEYYNDKFNGDNFYTKCIKTYSTSTSYVEVSTSADNGGKYTTITKANIAKTTKVTFINAQYISIPVEKRWNINTSSLMPENDQLIVRIGSSTAYWGTYVPATLTPSTEDNNLWTGTVNKVPYYADANYYVREIWNPTSPPTTETVMESVDSEGNAVSLGTVTTPSSTYRQVSNVKGSVLEASEKIRITNTELISLTIEKQWFLPDGQTPGTAEIVVQALGSSNKVLEEYTFLLTESEPSVTREIPYNSDVVSYVISEPEHSGYAVSYQVVKITGTDIEAEGDKVTILPSAISDVEKVVFTNTAENEITVRKEWIGGSEDSVAIALAPSGQLSSLESTVTLNAAAQWKGTLKVKYDPAVTSYKIWETFSNAEDYNSTVKIGSKAYNGSSVDNLTYTELVNAGEIVFTNEKTGSLVVTKKVKGTYASPKEEFEITIKLMDASGNLSDYAKTITYGSSDEKNVTFINGVAKVSLKNGESIRIPEIPIGYRYQVTESSYDNYTVTYQVNDETEAASALGTIFSNALEQKVTVINTLNDIVVTGIFSDYSSSWMLLGIALIGVISYVALNYKKKKTYKERHIKKGGLYV